MPLLEMHNLSYSYPDGTAALRGVNLAIDEGESVGLIGPNGAGKSTLLWHTNGLLPEHPHGHAHAENGAGQGSAGQGGADGKTGAVRVAGLAATRQHLPAIRRTVGLLFQDPDDQLFCPTVREDVAFGPVNLGLPKDQIRRRVRDALVAVDLPGFEDRSAHHLSVGERKRVCLAGVLACQPQLLALDEPSANLDPRARRHLIGILHGLECAKLIASHDLEMILELCDRVVVLDEGRVRADGAAREILSNESLLEAHGLELPSSLRHTTG